MPTDDERLEVARRLREIADCCEEVSYFDLARTLGLVAVSRYGYDSDDVRRLADLIEPSEPKVRCVAEVKVDGERLERLAHDAATELTGVDRDALLALADDMESFGGENDRTLRRMGVFVDSWASCTRRIREALGVDDA